MDRAFREERGLAAFFLHKLTALGLRKQTITLWKRYYGDCVDVKIRGMKYRLNLVDNVTDRKILCSAIEYNHKELKALKESCRGGVFVDVGANIGYYSLTIAASGASYVLAIEPNPAALQRLRFNIKINGLERIIAVVAEGIGRNGYSNLTSTGNLGKASLLFNRPSDLKSAIIVKTQPLLNVVMSHHIQRIDGMKIDIEGSEDYALMPFFENAPKTLWPGCLVIEHAHQNIWTFNILSHLLAIGYKKAGKTRSNTILKLLS